jgi:hypothetical protein
MKKPFAVRTLLPFIVLFACASIAQAQAPPAVSITLQNPPPGQLLELPVGESYTFEIHVASSEPFLLTMVMADQYYPGRGIWVRGGDRAVRDDQATLYLTVTAKASTAGLPAVCDWPEPGVCWPAGVAPVSLTVGARFPGGLVVADHFDLAVVVP